MKKTMVIAIVALLLAPIAAARKALPGTLTVTPDPPVLAQPATYQGCGYDPSAWYMAYVIWPDSTVPGGWTGYHATGNTGADGCLQAAWTPTVAGTHRIYIYQAINGHANSIEKVRGFLEFTVAG